MSRLTLLAALLTLCLTAPCVQASEGVPLSQMAPAGLTHADGLLRSALVVADRANAQRGYPASSSAQLFVYDAHDGKGARADTPGNRIYVDRQYRNQTWTLANQRGLPRAFRVGVLAGVCELLAHERLHNQGHGHVEGDPGHMLAPHGRKRPRPAACVAWAKREMGRRSR